MVNHNQKQNKNKDTKETKGPLVETRIAMSEDKKWVIHQTIITDIKPVNYMKKVLEGS